MSEHTLRLSCLSALLAVASAHAASPSVGAASAGAGTRGIAASAETQQRLRQDMQLMLSRLAASGALGQHPEQIDLRLDEPARRVTNLGILVDSTSAERASDGLRVLGATPGSTGERLGLRPGDVIVTVNSTSLKSLGADADGHALAAATLKSTVETLPDSAPLQLAVVRGGTTLALNAPLQSVYVPALRMELGTAAATGADAIPADTAAASTAPAAADSGGGSAASGGCGRISDFDVSPHQEHLYLARILAIDGQLPGPQGSKSFRVSAGEHHLVVAENIPTRDMGVGEIAALRHDTSKKLVVNVEAGTTVLIAAQFHPEKATQFINGAFWDPIAWRVIPESCP
jgi:hypothetical protein